MRPHHYRAFFPLFTSMYDIALLSYTPCTTTFYTRLEDDL